MLIIIVGLFVTPLLLTFYLLLCIRLPCPLGALPRCEPRKNSGFRLGKRTGGGAWCARFRGVYSRQQMAAYLIPSLVHSFPLAKLLIFSHPHNPHLLGKMLHPFSGLCQGYARAMTILCKVRSFFSTAPLFAPLL